MNEQEFAEAFEPVSLRFVTVLARLLDEEKGIRSKITVEEIKRDEVDAGVDG